MEKFGFQDAGDFVGCARRDIICVSGARNRNGVLQFESLHDPTSHSLQANIPKDWPIEEYKDVASVNFYKE
jgi:hypothetical protein